MSKLSDIKNLIEEAQHELSNEDIVNAKGTLAKARQRVVEELNKNNKSRNNKRQDNIKN